MPKKISEELKKRLIELYHAGHLVQDIYNDTMFQKGPLYNWIHLYSKVKTEGMLKN